MIKLNDLLEVRRLKEHQEIYPEIKDPSVVALPNGTYLMYASVGRSSDQQWIIGRFESSHPKGLWQEIAPAKIIGVAGPQMCAPAVRHEKDTWIMYVQTACFEENGVIVEAHSDDGEIFKAENASVITKDHVKKGQQLVVGVYDAGISEVNINGETGDVLVFSGYRKVGSGDLYAAYKKKAEHVWGPAHLVLTQEEVAFHNKPGSEHFEWGLEGGKIIQVSEKCFLLIAVCFLPLPKGSEGKRQRVFFAASTSIYGPFIPLGMPFQPQKYETGSGEHGHPDTILLGNELWIIFQERKGDGHPWHLRYGVIDFQKLGSHAEQTLMMNAY